MGDATTSSPQAATRPVAWNTACRCTSWHRWSGAFRCIVGYGTNRFAGIGLLGLGLLASTYFEALTVPLQAQLRQGQIAAAEIVRQAVQLAAIGGLIAAGAGLVPFFAIGVPGALAATAVAFAGGAQLVRPRLGDRYWWRLLRDAAPFAAASAISVFYLRSTLIVCSLVATPRQTGYFGTAFRVMEVLIGVPLMASSALFPLLARSAAGDVERFQGAGRRIIETALIAGGLAAALVFAGAPLAVYVITGHS